MILSTNTIIGGKDGVDWSSDDDVANFVDDDKSYDKYDDFEDHKAITTDDIWLYGGHYLMMKLYLVWSPERKRSLSFPPGEFRRLLLPSSGVWSPCGPQLLPAVVLADKE